MDKIVNILTNHWNGNDEDKAVVMLYFVILLCGLVTLIFMVPFLISAKSTVLVIFGFLSPFIFGAAMWHLFRVFFIDLERQ